MFALLFFILPLILFKSIWKGCIKRDLTTQKDKGREREVADISGKQCISTEGGKNGQGKKKKTAAS